MGYKSFIYLLYLFANHSVAVFTFTYQNTEVDNHLVTIEMICGQEGYTDNVAGIIVTNNQIHVTGCIWITYTSLAQQSYEGS